jgi:SAM-dependent methyltransferase
VDFTIYRDLPDPLWADLVFGNASLPPLPPEDLQRSWCGNAGPALATQSCEFYQLLKSAVARYGTKPYLSARVLDFGCGWGRLTRLLVKDLHPSQIYGCDPDEEILKWCTQVPGTFARSDHRPRAIPFDVKFDLAFAFSVFTHLGPGTHQEALDALHNSLADDGLLVATIRPRAFIEQTGIELARLSDESIRQMLEDYDAGSFVYQPYILPPIDGEVTYGDAAIPLAYVERHWLDRYELLSVENYSTDPFQVPLVMRKR